MNKLFLKISAVCTLLFASCGKPDVAVSLSLYETDYYNRHYVRVLIRNNTNRALFVPHFRDCLSVYCGDVDVTGLIDERRWRDPCDSVLVHLKPDTLELRIYRYKIDGASDEAFAHILKTLPIDPDTLSEERLSWLRTEIDFVWMMKYDGVFLKSGEEAEHYLPIHRLYDPKTDRLKSNFTILFRRHDCYEGFVHDSIELQDCKAPVQSTKNILGYEYYEGPVECRDILYLKGSGPSLVESSN